MADETAEAPAGVDYHERLASGWTDRYAGGGFRRRYDFVAGSVLPDTLAGQNWIDVGCGSGVFTRLLAERGAKALGVDGAAAMVAAAEGGGTAGGALRYRRAAVEELGGIGERFDGLLCLSVVEYVDDPDAAFADFAALLVPGGRLVMSVPNALAPVRLAQRAARRLGRVVGVDVAPYLAISRHGFTPRRLVRALAAHGLAVRRVLGFDPLIGGAAGRLLPASLTFVDCERRGGDGRA